MKLNYEEFGSRLLKLREQAGIEQADLAKLIGSSQQNISRWELGKSRPRNKFIPLIADALNADLNDLLVAAGYIPTPQSVTTSFDQPFPFYALSPRSFERFCEYFLEAIYKKQGVKVHGAGASGHDQDGIDIDVIFPDGSIYNFQCKRVNQFGPQKVDAAVAKNKKEAKEKFLILGCVASPQAREAICAHSGWEIWDREDLSKKIRQELTKDEQIKLVDIFFRGQRLTLLGEMEPGPWQTDKIFWEPFKDSDHLFNHAWDLVGRAREIEKIIDILSNPQEKLIFLVGKGGVGKSRILKAFTEKYQEVYSDVMIRFLSPRQAVTPKSLEDLGTGKKLLVIDDAHEEDNLQLLFQYAETSSNNAILLLSLRPYGLDKIKSQVSHVENVHEIYIEPLNLEYATELAKQVLKVSGGSENDAEIIAELTLDCSLATVVTAKIISKKGGQLELIKNECFFRDQFSKKFREIFLGEIGGGADKESIKKILKIVSLIQPFYPEDPSVSAIIEQQESVKTYDTVRIINFLAKAGVFFKRAGKYRISPDMLADFLIEEACVGESGRSTGYAESLFNVIKNEYKQYLENILLNFGKLDWRRKNGNTDNSTLLNDMWNSLDISDKTHISAVISLAPYQPEKSLSFARRVIQESKETSVLPELIKYAAYNIDHLPEACGILWDLGKEDKRQPQQYPYHAIRVLSDFCAIKPNKPIEYNRKLVDFGLFLLKKDSSWNYCYTPFDILKPILQAEGRDTYSKGINFYIRPFSVKLNTAVVELRRIVIDNVIDFLSHPIVKRAVLAARFLEAALHYPFYINDISDHDAWTQEFIIILEKINQAILTKNIDSIVLVEIARSISWHANHNTGKIKLLAEKILESLPGTLEFRTTSALIDRWDNIKGVQGAEGDLIWKQYLDSLTFDLFKVYPEIVNLYSFIENTLEKIECNFSNGNKHPILLYEPLLESSLPLVRLTLEKALLNPNSQMIQFCASALFQLLRKDHDGAIKIIHQFLDSENKNLHVAVARGYFNFDIDGLQNQEVDINILSRLLSGDDFHTILSAISSVRCLVNKNPSIGFNLLKKTNIGKSSRIADCVLSIFTDNKEAYFNILTEEEVDFFLTQLIHIPELEGYWVEVFLANTSKYYPVRTAQFFMDRVEIAENKKNWRYRPSNYGPYLHVPLRFRESPGFREIFEKFMRWMSSHKNSNTIFYQNASELFNVIVGVLDHEVIGLLNDWLKKISSPTDFKIISYILSKSSNDLIYDHTDFVIHYLESTNLYSKQCYEEACLALFSSAISGGRSGKLGEPFPEDIRLKKESERVIQEISPFSSAYQFFKDLKKYADENISRSIRDGEFFEQ